MNKPDNPLAFPNHTSNGMTLRDWFAGQSLAGQRASESDIDCDYASSKDSAMMAYEDADAMLAEREKRT